MDKKFWTSPVVAVSADPVTAAATIGGIIDLADLGLNIVRIQAQAVFGATVETGCQLDVYVSADEGTTLDIAPLLTATIDMVTSGTGNIGTIIKDEPYLTFVLTNLDATEDCTAQVGYVGHYQSPAGRLE